MDLSYIFPGVDYSVDSILLFQDDGQWWDVLFYFYPQINRDKFDSLPTSQQKTYLRDILQKHYNDNAKSEIDNKVVKYNAHWKLHKNQIEDAFYDAFQCDIKDIFNDVVGNITFNPICPRFLSTRTFDVFYKNSERGALGVSLHELIHFVWFDVWQKHFDDCADEYETPHLKWVFSEMVVDPIMRHDRRLKDINPYFDDGCAYECFYLMSVNNIPILDTLYKMYVGSKNVVEFMEQGYAYCNKYEHEIRTQMQ